MTLELDKKQYENLLKLAALGNALANNYREDPIDEFDEIVEMLYLKAATLGLPELVQKDEEGTLYPSEGLEMILHSFVEEYEQGLFWDRLIESLVERDLIAKHGEAGLDALSDEDYLAEEAKLAADYASEFEKNDLANLYLKK